MLESRLPIDTGIPTLPPLATKDIEHSLATSGELFTGEFSEYVLVKQEDFNKITKPGRYYPPGEHHQEPRLAINSDLYIRNSLGLIHQAYDLRTGRYYGLKVINEKAFPPMTTRARSVDKLTIAEAQDRAILGNHHQLIPQLGITRLRNAYKRTDDYNPLAIVSPWLDFNPQAYTHMADTIEEMNKQYSEDKNLSDKSQNNSRANRLFLTTSTVSQLANIYSYIHSHKQIHGDASTSNVIFDIKNTPILTDFGGGYRSRKILSEELNAQTRFTASHSAPELWLEGSYVDQRVDVYGYGSIIFEFITGVPLVETESDINNLIVNAFSDNPQVISMIDFEEKEDVLVNALIYRLGVTDVDCINLILTGIRSATVLSQDNRPKTVTQVASPIFLGLNRSFYKYRNLD